MISSSLEIVPIATGAAILGAIYYKKPEALRWAWKHTNISLAIDLMKFMPVPLTGLYLIDKLLPKNIYIQAPALGAHLLLTSFCYRHYSRIVQRSNIISHYTKKLKEPKDRELEKDKLENILKCYLSVHPQLSLPTVEDCYWPLEVQRDGEIFLKTLDINLPLKQVLKYINKSISSKKLPISKKNGNLFLSCIKRIDKLALSLKTEICYKKNTYKLRFILLKILNLPTSAVFTHTRNPSKWNHLPYLIKPESWVEPRLHVQAKIVAEQRIAAESLDKRIDHITALRGNTASGKSTFIYGVQGVLNVDIFKALLKAAFIAYIVLNKNIHAEGAAVFEAFRKEFCEKHKFVLDSRLLLPKYLEEEVLAPARRQRRNVEVIDLDTPLEVSYERILQRDPFGPEPCPPANVLSQGFRDCRKYRAEIITMVMKEPLVTSYKLYRHNHLIAEKKGNDFLIYVRDLFEECLREPNEEEIAIIDSCWKKRVDKHSEGIL